MTSGHYTRQYIKDISITAESPIGQTCFRSLLLTFITCKVVFAAAKSLQSCSTLCNSIDRQPTRLCRPWDSPRKNTGVGCHFLLQCRKVKSESEVTQSGLILSDPMDCSLPGSSVHGIFQAKVLEWGAIAFSESGLYLGLI